MHVVLVEPEIPHNTGNIARTCALTGSTLHLVKPLGFSLEDRFLKRAGLDYWDRVDVRIWECFADFLQAHPGLECYFASTRAGQGFTEIDYDMNVALVFGKESAGLSDELLARHKDRLIRIPMRDFGRSLNLSNAAAIIIYEVLRQHDYPGLK